MTGRIEEDGMIKFDDEDVYLIIRFTEENGQEVIKMGYQPEFEHAVTPKQKAAVSVAESIINGFHLNEEGKDNE